MSFGKPDRPFYFLGKPRKATLDAWYEQGLPKMPDAGEYGCPPEFYGLTGQDRLQWGVQVDFGLVPAFETKVISEDESRRVWVDTNGIVMLDSGAALDTPGFRTRSYISHPVSNRTDWEDMKRRYDPTSPERYDGIGWSEWARGMVDRDFPVMASLPSMYWKSRDWVGFENLSMMFLDDPDLVHEMMEHVTIFLMEVMRRAVQEIHVDAVVLNEDMAYKHASMISPAMFREFMMPRYKRLVKFFKELGVPLVMVDCDGHVGELIPLWLEAGIDGTYPIEIAANNDPVAYRQKFGKQLSIFGGIDKREIRSRERVYEEVMKKVPYLLEQGGHIPCFDHAIPPDVPLDGYLYMVEVVRALIFGRPVPGPKAELDLIGNLDLTALSIS
jgi:uroporphyrinogen decarboxylase